MSEEESFCPLMEGKMQMTIETARADFIGKHDFETTSLDNVLICKERGQIALVIDGEVYLLTAQQ